MYSLVWWSSTAARSGCASGLGGRLSWYENAFCPDRQELTQLGRDRLTLALALGLPLILLLLFGFAVSLDVNKINFAIQDLDRTPQVAVYATFERTSSSWLLLDQNQRASTARSGQNCSRSDRTPEFSRDLSRRGREAQVQILVDGTDANTNIRGYAKATQCLCGESRLRQ